jgi:RNA polymerase sigma-70 factor (ECF subfamily)
MRRSCSARDPETGCRVNDSAGDRTLCLRHAVDSSAPALPLEREAELVERARRDPAAFAALYEAHYHSILNYLYRRTLSVTAAEELTSNTFFKALRGLPGFHPRPTARFRSWLYRIATNEARMYWRGRKVRRETPLCADENELPRIGFAPSAADPLEAVREKQKQFALLHQALGRLPERYQAVLTLRYFEAIGHEQIAEILGKPVGTVKSLVHRGLARLAKIMDAPGATQ